MKKITCTLTILLAALLAAPATVSAQDPYDDLYFSPSKEAEKKKKAEEARRKAQAEWDAKYGTPAADTYTGGSTMPRNVDVDVFNRRNSDAANASGLTEDMSGNDAFAYTRRLERYHNPDIVSASNDSTLQEYYYSTPSENDINVYVINTIDPFDYGWGATPWSWGWYNPYRYNFWGPRWSIGWGFDPWFDFSWGWGSPWYGPSWGWGWSSPWYGPSWGWGWGWTGGCHWHPSWGGAPLPPGGHHGWASRPMRPGFNGGRGNATASRRPGYGITRPGSQNRPTWSGASSGANSRPGYRPGNASRPGSTYRPSGTSRPGSSDIYRPGSSGNNNNNSYRPSNNSRRGNSGNSYNYNSGSSQRNSSPSWNSSRGSNNSSRGGGGGGSYRGGGGGGRGRR